MRPKKSLLFVCPTHPSDRGNGLAMRAGTWLRALAKEHRVYLLIIPIAANKQSSVPQGLAELCEEVKVIEPGLVQRAWIAARSHLHYINSPHEQAWLGFSLMNRIDSYCKEKKFDRILVHRLYLAPAIRSIIRSCSQTASLALDVDDIESRTRDRIAELCNKRGEPDAAKHYQREASFYRKEEKNLLPLFDTVVTCSTADQKTLSTREGLQNIKVVPNCIPAVTHAKRQPGTIFRFLFVGNRQYLPNKDAIDYLTTEILPLLRNHSKRPFEIVIVGSGPCSSAANESDSSEISFLGEVEDIAECYHQADAVLVPIRAGGGTRIKVIEAFAFGLPVVSTSCGAEGLDAVPERHLLIGDSTEAFVSQSARLMEETSLRQNLAAAAYTLYQSQFSEDVVFSKISEVFA